MNNYRFGVVIVTYNRLSLLKECIENVINQERTFDSVTIINNNSNDGTREYLETINRIDFKVIHSKENLGGAGGFKLGIESTSSKIDYLLLIDDDAMLCPNFLKDIENSIVDGIVAYSGTVQTDGAIDKTHRRRITNDMLLTHKDVSESEYQRDFFDYDLSTFCGLLINTEIIKKIGLPKSEYFIWYDDSEYSLRIRKYSKIRNINSAIINHKTKLSYSDRFTWKSYYGYRNKIDMGRNYSSCPLIFISYRILYHSIRTIQYSLKSIFAKKIDRKYYRFSANLSINVISDSLKGKLGKNSKYLPS